MYFINSSFCSLFYTFSLHDGTFTHVPHLLTDGNNIFEAQNHVEKHASPARKEDDDDDD